MAERIEAFLLDILEDEGESSRLVRENTRRYLATYEEMFRDEGACADLNSKCEIEAATPVPEWRVPHRLPSLFTHCDKRWAILLLCSSFRPLQARNNA